MVVSAQLNQEPKKITKKFFSEHNDIENITPALKKKKGFTNYQELLSYIDEKVQNYPELVSSNFKATELMQYLNPVGLGPSGKT